MINTLFQGFLKILIMFIDFLLTPINNFIEQYLPSVDYVLDLMYQFFSFCTNLMQWILSWFNVPAGFINFLIVFTVFRLTVPYLVHNAKVLAAWWDTFIA